MRQLEFYSGEQQIFDLFFASVASLAHCHPGNNRENTKPKTIEECADIALEMLEVRREVMDNSRAAAHEREQVQRQAMVRKHLEKQFEPSYEDPFYDPVL